MMNEASNRSNPMTATWKRLKDFLTAPSPAITRVEEQRVARLAASFLFLIAFFEFVGGAARFVTLGLPLSEAFSGSLGFTFIPTLIAYGLSRTQYVRAAIFLFSFFYSAAAYSSILAQGPDANTALLILIYVVPGLIVASSFLSPRTVLSLAGLNVVAFVITHMSLGGMTGEAMVQVAMIAMLGLLLVLLASFRSSLERFRLDQVQAANRQLEDLTATLEQRVGERTHQLETANRQVAQRAAQLQTITELSEAIAQLQDLNAIFPEATRLINESFGFYHVGIFLIDSAREYAILQAANSAGGKRMLARSHRLQLGTGVVGYAAQTGIPRIALDVGADAVFFNNPDLPETRSEVALPMKSRGETIGILDVQSVEAAAFSNEDLQILTALANQVAIAIENARLLTETRAALIQVQGVYDEFTRAEWTRTVARAELPGFRYHGGRIELIEKGWKLPEVVEAVESGSVITGSSNGSTEKHSTVAVPVKLRGEVIGVIHIESNDPARLWLQDEISLVEAVAERAAFAMENARLFQDARRRAAKERAISEATSRISTALNIENILHTTAEELERVLGGSEVSIRFQGRE